MSGNSVTSTGGFLARSSGLTLTGNFSAYGAFKLNGNTTTGQFPVLFQLLKNGPTETYFEIFQTPPDDTPANQLDIQHRDSPGNTSTAQNISASTVYGKWVHWGVTVDGTTRAASIYFILEGFSAGSPSFLYTTSLSTLNNSIATEIRLFVENTDVTTLFANAQVARTVFTSQKMTQAQMLAAFAQRAPTSLVTGGTYTLLKFQDAANPEVDAGNTATNFTKTTTSGTWTDSQSQPVEWGSAQPWCDTPGPAPRPPQPRPLSQDGYAPVGALIATAALSSLGWLAVPHRQPTVTPQRVDVVAPIGTGTFALTQFVDNVASAPQVAPRGRSAPEAIQPIGTLISSGALSSLGWLQIDTASPRPAARSFVVAVAGNESPATVLGSWFDSSVPTSAPVNIARRVEPSAPIGTGTFALPNAAWRFYEQTRSRAAAPPSVDTSAPVGSLLTGGLTSLGWLGFDARSSSISSARADQSAQQPVNPLRPFVSASCGFLTTDAKSPPALGPRAQEAQQPTSPLSPFVSVSTGWLRSDVPFDTPIVSRQVGESSPVGSLLPPALTSLGWLRTELPLDTPILARLVSDSSPTGTLLTPQPFGWNSAIDQARPAPVVSRRADPSAPVGTAFAIALPSNGWLATDNPRTPLALQRSTPTDPVGNLLVLPPLPGIGWLATDNPRTPLTLQRSVPVDPVGAKFFVPPALGPFWFVELPARGTAPGARVAPSEPVGALFSTLTSLGWLAPTDSPRATVSPVRPQPSEALRGLQFGGTPWVSVEVQSTRPVAARAVDVFAPVGSLITSSLTGLGWMPVELVPRQAQPARAQDPAAPVGPLVPFVSTSSGWQVVGYARPIAPSARNQEASAPVGSPLSATSLSSLGWQIVTSDAPKVVARRPVPISPVGAFIPPPVLPSLSWLATPLPPTQPIVALRVLPIDPPGLLFASFVAANISHTWPTVADLTARMRTWRPIKV